MRYIFSGQDARTTRAKSAVKGQIMETQELKALIKEIIQEVLQQEKLTLYNTLLPYINNTENQEWNQFSLEQAMRGLENDHLPEYTEADIIEKWQ